MARTKKPDGSATGQNGHLGSDADVTETSRLLNGAAGRGTDGTADDDNSRPWDGLADFEGLPWWRTPSPFWLLAPYFLFTLAFGSIIVPKLNLIVDLVCQRYFANQTLLHPDQPHTRVDFGKDNPQCDADGVQKLVSIFLLGISLCTGLLSAITAPRMGHLSDRYGRRKLLALASAGGVLGEVITIMAAKFPESFDYRWLMLGAVFDGLFGSFTAANIISQSYTSDVTPPSRRAVAIGYIHATLFIGLALGQLLGGYIAKLSGSLVTVFYVCTACHTFFILFVGFVIPESLSERKQLAAQEKHRKEKEAYLERHGSWKSSIRAKNPFVVLKVLYPTGPGTTMRLRINLIALAICDMIIMGSAISAGAVILLYARKFMHWGTFESSIFISSVSFVRVIVLLGIFPFINYFFRIRPAARLRRDSGIAPVDRNRGADNLDIWVLRVALLSDITGYVGYLSARSPRLFFASGMVTAMGGLGSATCQAVVTKHVPQDQVGRVLGAVGMLQALVRVVGPILFNGIYAATIESYPQTIFVTLAGIFSFAFLCTFLIKPNVYLEEAREEEREPLNPAQQAFNTNTNALPLNDEEFRI